MACCGITDDYVERFLTYVLFKNDKSKNLAPAATFENAVWLAAFTDRILPSDTISDVSEVSGGGYARVQLYGNFDDFRDRSFLTNAAVAFAGPVTDDWGLIKAFGILLGGTGGEPGGSPPSGGELFAFMNICPQNVNSGDAPPTFKEASVGVGMGVEDGCC